MRVIPTLPLKHSAVDAGGSPEMRMDTKPGFKGGVENAVQLTELEGQQALKQLCVCSHWLTTDYSVVRSQT